ncbi:4-coumarate-coA ligase 2 [Encephalitozoon intestinalis]
MGTIRFISIISFLSDMMIWCIDGPGKEAKDNLKAPLLTSDNKPNDFKASPIPCSESTVRMSRFKDMMNRIRIMEDGSVQHVNFQRDVVCTPDGSKTILELLLSRCATMGNEPFLGTIVGNEVKYKTANDIRREAEGLASFLAQTTSPGDMVGIYSVNRYEWIVAEMATYMCGCTNVPLYSMFSPENVQMILKETGMKVCVASREKAEQLVETVLEGRETMLEHIVLMDKAPELVARLENAGLRGHYLKEVISHRGGITKERYSKGEDLATICYTSGTSGCPKGVMLTHRNFISGVSGIFRGSRKEEMVSLDKEDVYLSYLPLAHVMERICVNISMAYGCKIVFYRGNMKEIKEDYLVAKPTFIISVPRVLNLFKDKIEEKVRQKNFVLRWIFRGALRYKMWRVGRGELKSKFADWLVFNRIAKEFGGRISRILCGSAPLRKEVLVYMQAVLSCRIIQGYGQTENVGSGIVQPLDTNLYDNVGIPFPSNEVKLGEIPAELGSEYGRRYPGRKFGEILLRGDNVTQGYFKRPEETAELFTKDGWLRTGDIGMFDVSTGMFSVIGRLKDGFKTAQGEYIDPEKLETLYIDGDIIQDVFIPRRSESERIIAIVVCPDEKKSEKEIMEHLREVGEKLVKQRRITRLEIPSKVIVLRRGFESFEGADLLTPTAKKKRALVEKYFAEEIDKTLGIK